MCDDDRPDKYRAGILQASVGVCESVIKLANKDTVVGREQYV